MVTDDLEGYVVDDVLLDAYLQSVLRQHLTADKGAAMYRWVVHHIGHFCFSGPVASSRKHSMLRRLLEAPSTQLVRDVVLNPANETTTAMLAHVQDLPPFAAFRDTIQLLMSDANASVAPTPNRPPPSIAASERSSMSSDGDDSDLISDTLSEADSKRRNERPRFDSSVSYADSTRLDRFDSRASMLSNRERSDSRASSSSRASISSRRSARASELRTTTAKTPDLDAIDEEDYQFVSPFADFDAHDQPIREQLQKGLEIVNEHTSKLKEIEDALSAAMSEVWGYWADPIQLHLHPAERVDVQDLIRTDNELFNKVLTVFAVLCDEISELKVTVEDNFYPALIMFGQAKHGDKGDVKPGEDEVHIGRMLPFFQDISNFVDRCNSIATNLVHQLASLYQSFQKLWKSTFKHVHLTTVFDAFGHVLEILLTLDLIVMDNPNIVTSWDKYKRMMQYVRADPARYNVTADQVKAFERLLVNLDGTFMGKKGVSCPGYGPFNLALGSLVDKSTDLTIYLRPSNGYENCI
ncbi:hypothetical protein DYB34_011215 [Aphanomyces astaci]|uniref:WASH complex subunit 4 N-terminal domain-containing protein n=2 Tax=Aphanomyces astaci TaxID=112090 RepID=A0A418BP35_APHAT|nr:hypothetical protein DYB34_011215 [Aphanomyces astaci]